MDRSISGVTQRKRSNTRHTIKDKSKWEKEIYQKLADEKDTTK